MTFVPLAGILGGFLIGVFLHRIVALLRQPRK